MFGIQILIYMPFMPYNPCTVKPMLCDTLGDQGKCRNNQVFSCKDMPILKAATIRTGLNQAAS